MDLPLDLRHASITVREATRAVLTLVLEPPGNDNRRFVVLVRLSTLQSGSLQRLDHTRLCASATIPLIWAACPPPRRVASYGLAR
jgi:hypothetical protein